MSNLLCVDWDWFFYSPMEAGDFNGPTWQLWDWGHRESEFFLSNMVWTTRASSFFGNDLPLPRVTKPEGGWASFWSRFTFADDPWFGYADSNAHAGLVRPPDGSRAFDEVVLFDAHHDSGYHVTTYGQYLKQDTFTCEDWLLEHQRCGTDRLTVRYPAWKPSGPTENIPKGSLTRLTLDDGEPVPGVFDAIFVCRSGAWVPPWCDRDFLDFIEAAPMDGVQVDDAELDRDFNDEAARAMGESGRKKMADFDAQRGGGSPAS